MARDNQWYIDQRLLYTTLGFGCSKIPMEVEKTFPDFAVPIGIRYEVEDVTTDRGIRRIYRRIPISSRTATVIVKSKQPRYAKKLFGDKVVRVHDAKQRVFIVCPNCGREVPFSRMQQHYGKKTCSK